RWAAAGDRAGGGTRPGLAPGSASRPARDSPARARYLQHDMRWRGRHARGGGGREDACAREQDSACQQAAPEALQEGLTEWIHAVDPFAAEHPSSAAIERIRTASNQHHPYSACVQLGMARLPANVSATLEERMHARRLADAYGSVK